MGIEQANPMRSGGVLRRAMAVPFLLALAVALVAPHTSFARTPLIVEGTQSIFQRVLSRPGAGVYETIAAETLIESPPVFSHYYVFARQTEAGREWLEVGPNRAQEPTGWVLADKTLPWRQSIVLSFGNSQGRLPVLFFDQQEKLEELIANPQLGTRAQLLTESISTNQLAPDSGVVAVEPEETVPLIEQFYMLPILEAKRTPVASCGPRCRSTKVVKVASIPAPENEVPKEDVEPEPFRVGVVFAIDTTRSMGPFIERTREAVKKIYDQISATPEGDKVSFGIVGFRDNVEAAPGLEYVSKTFMPLAPEFDANAFLSAVDGMQAADVSSQGFAEDGLAGVWEALESTDWEPFGGRYIIYITDAPYRTAGNDLSSTKKRAQDINAKAQDDVRKVAIYSLFLETPAGRDIQGNAKEQLDILSAWEGSDPLVFSVPNGSVDEFGNKVDGLAQSLISGIEATRQGQLPDVAECDANPESMNCITSEVGRAMILSWLGRQNEARAPDVFEAWAADFALNEPLRRAMDIRVLLTKNQLNDTYIALKAIEQAAGQMDDSPDDFFVVLQSVTANLLTDPYSIPGLDSSSVAGSLELSDFPSLGDLLGEYMADLPYRSDIAEITPPIWRDMSDGDRDSVIIAIKSKLAMYESYYADTDKWILLNESAGDGEAVYPVPLSLMP